MNNFIKISVFSICLLLLLLFEGSYLGYYVVGLISFIYILFLKKLDWSRLHYFSFSFLSWVIFLSLLALSSFFTHSLPLTLNSILFYSFSFVTFWFFLLIKEKKDWQRLIPISLFLVVLVLSILSLFFSFVPIWGTLIPGKNVFYASYGHNHLAVLLLLVIPVVWWFVIGRVEKIKKKEELIIPLIVASIATLAQLLTYGRTAILITLFQLVSLLFFLSNKNKNNFGKIFSFVIHSIIFVFIVVIFSFIFLSTISSIYPEFSCPSRKLTIQICKPFSREGRLDYWKQSLKSIKESPIFGYGPGTFSLISQKYRDYEGSRSSFAHNAFLQVAAESGIPAALAFLILMITLIFKVSKKVFTFKKYSLHTAIWIGVISVSINALFDFDWSFLGVFSLTLILIAITSDEREHKSKGLNILPLFLPIFVGLVVMLVTFSSTYFVVNSLLDNEKTTQAFSVFPYFSYHKNIFALDGNLNSDQKQKLKSIYKYHPDFYQLVEGEDEITNQILKEIDPIDHVTKYDFEYYFERDEYQKAESEIQNTMDFYEQNIKGGIQAIPYDWSSKAALKLLKIADHYFINSNYEKAGLLYKEAIKLDEWTWYGYKPTWMELKNLDTNAIDFFRAIDVSEFNKAEVYGDQITDLYWSLFLLKMESENIEEVLNDLNRFQQLKPDLIALHRQEILVILVHGLKTDYLNSAQRQSYINELLDFWLLVSKQEIDERFFWEQEIVEKTSFLLEQEFIVDPGFVLTALFDIKKQFPEHANNPKLLKVLLMVQKEIYKLSNNMEFASAEELIIKMQKLFPNDYLLQSQLAHFYLFQLAKLKPNPDLSFVEIITNQRPGSKLKNKATKAYDLCLETFENDHYDCELGKKHLLDGFYTPDHFLRVSELLELKFSPQN